MAPPRKKSVLERDLAEPFLVKLDAYLKANKDAGVTAAGLSIKAGLSDSVIRGWLSGKASTPTIASARKVCEAMGTTLEQFLSEAQTPEEHEIVALVMQLPADLRQMLLGYGRGLLDAQDRSRKEPDEGRQ